MHISIFPHISNFLDYYSGNVWTNQTHIEADFKGLQHSVPKIQNDVLGTIGYFSLNVFFLQLFMTKEINLNFK